MKPKKPQISRRSFLTGAGAAALGVSIARAPIPAIADEPSPLPVLPWGTYYPTSGLDAEAIREQAFCRNKEGGCGYGGAQAILDALADEVGYPWTVLPKGPAGVGLTSYGGGGVVGWGTICGALNGVIAVMGLLGVHGKLGNALMDYYCTAELPTAALEGFQPECATDPLPAVVSTVSNSPLCHVSVSTWAEAQGVPVKDALKGVRCGRLVGDIAYRAVELMNEYFVSGLTPAAWQPGEEYAECYSCHTQPDIVPSQSGKMDCLECHSVSEMHDVTPVKGPWKLKGKK